MSENLEKDFETYDKLATSADNVPPWFADVTRTLGTRNITVELWNTLCQNVRKLASDCNTQDEFIRVLNTYLSSAIDSVNNNTLAINTEIQERKDADAKKLDIIEPDDKAARVYSIGALSINDTYGNLDNIPYLRKATVGADAWSLAVRDANGELRATNQPNSASSAISSVYVSTKITPIVKNLEEITRRVDSIEYASMGNIYENITLNNVGKSLQVDNACPWGIFSRLGCVTKLRCILPYQLSASVNIEPTGVNSFKFTSKTSFYIRCDIPTGTTLKIAAESSGKVKRFAVSSTANSSGFDLNVGSNGYFAANEFITTTKDCSYIVVEKAESEYTNFRVVFADNYVPTNAITEVSVIEVPEGIDRLSGYGMEGAYLDLIEKKLYTGYYAPQNIDMFELDNITNLPLLPGMIVQFIETVDGVNDEPKEIQYELTYKNKI